MYLHFVCLVLTILPAIGIHIQIFDNVAEILKPISPYALPITFSREEWNTLRSDSFRLVGDYVNVQAQTNSIRQGTRNGQKILIQRAVNNQTYSQAIMIDEGRNFIHDLIDRTYYTLDSSRIRYLSPPPTWNYTVDFTFTTNSDEQLYLRYLQNNIRWKVRYDLILNSNDSDSFLQAYADIRYDGSTSLIIDYAELISGDLNIRTYASPPNVYQSEGFHEGMRFEMAAAPSISSVEELAGVYIFPITDSFHLPSSSNYILPMFRPTIDIERYAIIEKSFSRTNNRGQAKRGYHLRVPDHYLPKGQVFIRESNRLVGEISWSDRSANETNQFSLGEDPDLQYHEKVQLNSRQQVYEANGYRLILSTYTIQLKVINRKSRAMNFEYRLRFPSQETLSLKENTANNLLELEGAIILGMIATNANEEQQIQFTVETQ